MHQPENKPLLQLLVKAYNCTITDYFYFPEIVYAGTQKIERADLHFLLSEGLIRLSRFDSFGRYYTLSKKGDCLLRQFYNKSIKKRPTAVPLTQGCFYFNRIKNGHASSASCLLFL